MDNKDNLFTDLPARLLQGKKIKRSRVSKRMSYQPDGQTDNQQRANQEEQKNEAPTQFRTLHTLMDPNARTQTTTASSFTASAKPFVPQEQQQ